MPTWAWVLIAVAIVLVVATAVWQWSVRRRTEHLRGQFGSEYDRAIESADGRREAEAELAAREKRHEHFRLQPLSESARDRYIESWQGVQAQFVDEPRTAVSSADNLIQSVMRDRGYPVEDFDQRASDLSVDHAEVVEHYREGHRLTERTARGDESTEDLRLAMQHYRALFDELVNTSGIENGSKNNSPRVRAGREM